MEAQEDKEEKEEMDKKGGGLGKPDGTNGSYIEEGIVRSNCITVPKSGRETII